MLVRAAAVEGRGGSSLGVLVGRCCEEATWGSEAEVRPEVWLGGRCWVDLSWRNSSS